MFVFSCVGTGLVTGLIPLQRSPTTVCKIHSFALILNGNRPQRLNRQDRRSERNKEDLPASRCTLSVWFSLATASLPTRVVQKLQSPEEHLLTTFCASDLYTAVSNKEKKKAIRLVGSVFRKIS